MGGGGTRVKYEAPKIPKDDTFANYLSYQQERERMADQRAQQERAAEEEKINARRSSAQNAYGGLRSTVESQMRQGLIGYQDATNQLRDYAAKYDLTPPEADISSLTNIYTNELLPGQRSTAVDSAYEELLGRAASSEEKQKALTRFSQGYYKSNDDLKDSLLKSSEYQDKFNQSYLDNYYDTMYGKQGTDAAGKKTGQRTFKFSANLLPSYGGDLSGRTNVTLPSFGESFSGTPAELEEQTQNIRDTRQFLYSAGLTNLQGEIDKETQKLKNEGAKDVQKIQEQGGIYRALVGTFSFS